MVQIFVNDWMTSMGTVALLRLDPEQQIIKVDRNKLEIPIDWFKNLPETLFKYFVDEFSVAEREYRRLESLAFDLEKKQKDKNKYKDSTKNFNSRLKEDINRVKKYFPEWEEKLQTFEIEMKESIDSKNFSSLHQQIFELYQIFKLEEIDKKVTLNWVKGSILSQTGGQASFLNVSKNSLSFSEQMKVFEKDYINPVLWELQLQKNLLEKNESEIEALFQIDEKPDYATKWEKAKKKSKKSWCEWLNLLPECALLEGQKGTIPFEEMHFVPLGMSISNAYNYAWDGNLDTTQAISALAKLLLLISPLGANSYRRPRNGEIINVFGFLHCESSCNKTLMLNNQLANAMKSELHFSDALKDSFSKLKELEKKRRQVAILIEWNTEYKTKKTFLEYKPLNGDFVEYLLHEKSYITTKIYPYQFREEVVRAALSNIDSKHIIIREMRRVMDEVITKRFTSSIRNALIMREFMISKEGKEMGTEKLVTTQMYNLGYKLSRKLGDSREENKDGSYQASNEKKLTAIAYRLLNAVKAGNRQLFFDTSVRLHITAGMNISSNFTKALDPSTTDKEFATIALAFIAGLIPAEGQVGENSSENNSETVEE